MTYGGARDARVYPGTTTNPLMYNCVVLSRALVWTAYRELAKTRPRFGFSCGPLHLLLSFQVEGFVRSCGAV